MKHVRCILSALLCALILAVPASADVISPTSVFLVAGGLILTLVLIGAVIAAAVAVIVRIVRKRRGSRNDPE